MNQHNIEKRILELERVAHEPQNYRQRCMEMEKKVSAMEKRMDRIESILEKRNIQLKT